MREEVSYAFRSSAFEVFAQNPGLHFLVGTWQVQDTGLTVLHIQAHLAAWSRLFRLHYVDDWKHPTSK